jgi:microcystin-dependent protein
VHTHLPSSTANPGDQATPSNTIWATTATPNYSDGVGLTPVAMSSQTVTPTGSSQPHDNMMPTLTVSFIISLEGIYPSQN